MVIKLGNILFDVANPKYVRINIFVSIFIRVSVQVQDGDIK